MLPCIGYAARRRPPAPGVWRIVRAHAHTHIAASLRARPACAGDRDARCDQPHLSRRGCGGQGAIWQAACGGRGRHAAGAAAAGKVGRPQGGSRGAPAAAPPLLLVAARAGVQRNDCRRLQHRRTCCCYSHFFTRIRLRSSGPLGAIPSRPAAVTHAGGRDGGAASAAQGGRIRGRQHRGAHELGRAAQHSGAHASGRNTWARAHAARERAKHSLETWPPHPRDHADLGRC